jgi:hypothetical protein
MSKDKTNESSGTLHQALGNQGKKQVEEKALNLINALDKLIRDAGRVDRTACDAVDLLAPIANLTVRRPSI